MKSSVMSFIGCKDMYSRLLFLLIGLSLSSVLFAQKEKPKEEKTPVVNERQMLPPGAPAEKSKAPKKSKANRAMTNPGRKLMTQHRQKQRNHSWEEGDKLIYKVKDDKKKYKGRIDRIVPGKLLVDSVEIKLADITMVKANLFSQMKSKSKGMLQIGIGTPVVALGTFVIIYSYQSLDNESPTIVASALGMTLGAAIDLYGFSLMKKGAKSVFAGRKMAKDDGWIIKIR